MIAVEVVAHELGGDIPRGEADGRTEYRDRRAVEAPAAQGERNEREHRERPHDGGHHDRAPVRLAVVRRTPRDERHPADDRDHPDELEAPGSLAEHPRTEHQEQHEAGGERRLNHLERRVGEGQDFEREPDAAQSEAEQPPPSAHQAREQRQVHALVLGSLPRVQRLECDAHVEEHRGDDGGRQPEEEHAPILR